MSYRDKSGYEPLGRQRRSTRLQKMVAVLAIIAALLLLVSVYADSQSAPTWTKYFKWGIAPLGVVQWGMAWDYIERAGANDPEETYSQRALRFTALAFFLLGLVMVGVAIHDHFKGA